MMVTTATILLQRLPCTTTYQAANVQDYVSLTDPTTFLYYYNSTASSVCLVVSAVVPVAGSYNCYVVVLPANNETLIGPFDLTIYGSMISIATPCVYPAGVTVAALGITPPNLEIWSTEVSTLTVHEVSTSWAIIPIEFNGVETQKIIIYGQEPPQTIVVDGIESQKIIVLGSE